MYVCVYVCVFVCVCVHECACVPMCVCVREWVGGVHARVCVCPGLAESKKIAGLLK
jgi:hypothetical protein